MKIRDIEPHLQRAGHRNQLIVRVRAGDGLVGWGESGYTSREQSVIGAIDHLRSWLVGRDPRQRDALYQEMTRAGYYEGGRSLTAAAAAIDIALYDLIARAYGVPVYELLGGAHRNRILCYTHIPPPMTARSVDAARLAVEAGWRCVRVLIDHEPLSDPDIFDPQLACKTAVEVLPRIREAIGHGVVLGLHSHHRLTPFQVTTLLNKIPPGTIDYIEDPIRSESVDAYAALRSRVDIPFAHGTELTNKWAFSPFIRRGLMDLARVDVGLVGLTEAKKVAALAETHYVDIMPHNPLGPIATAAAVHLSASVSNHSYLEIRESPIEDMGFYDRRIFPDALVPDSMGAISLPTKPGLGVSVDEDQLSDQARYYEEPHWRLPDDTFTNW